MVKEFPILLAGEWHQNDHPLTVTNPYDNSEVGMTWLAQHEELERATLAAVEATPTLRKTGTWQRAEWLKALAMGVRERREELARMISSECGKPIRDARGEVERGIFTIEYAAEEAKRLSGEWMPLDLMPASAGKEGIVRRFPVGPVAAISPFNFPLNLALHKVAPAIAVGAPIVLKPPTSAPLTMLIVAEEIAKLNMPAGAVSILPMSRETGDLMVADDRFKLLSFTGSPHVGWDMKRWAGKKKVVLELGGNAGVYVHNDANLDFALQRLTTGAFAYAGQVCISVQRIFAHHDVYERVREGMIHGATSLKTGSPADETTELGPMIDLKSVDRIQRWIQEAVDAGASVLTGGKADGAFFPATVLEHVDPEATVCAQEAFAPVVILEKVDSFEHGIRALNRSSFGLQAGVFTNDSYRALAAFDSLEVGGVVLNDIPTYRIDHMPYGGVKDSGLGREGIRWSMQDMTEERLLVINRPPDATLSI